MRVISGTARGRKLKELQGMDTRPTTDKVKESIFNIIQFELEGRRVLDLFGGTGQLGIEALSRGAQRCTFVDQRREAAALIRENVKLVGFEDRSRVVQGEALSFLGACPVAYFTFFMVNAMRWLLGSTDSTATSTISPTVTTSDGCLTYRLQSCEICTSPS